MEPQGHAASRIGIAGRPALMIVLGHPAEALLQFGPDVFRVRLWRLRGGRTAHPAQQIFCAQYPVGQPRRGLGGPDLPRRRQIGTPLVQRLRRLQRG